MGDLTPLEALAMSDHALAHEECAVLARSAAGLVALASLERSGAGSFELLWRNEHSEGWLNTWWEGRDTGFHDHDGSCVGVHVLEGRVHSESLVVGGERKVTEYQAGDSFSLRGSGIHRVDHLRGAVTLHVYAPPLRAIGHYDIVDGELHRSVGPADEVSDPSPGLTEALAD